MLLAGIVAAAVLIRIPSLLHDGLWRDEAYVYIDVIAPTFREFLHRVVETEYHPPLFFLISYLWLRVAGTSELALMILPFLFSILTVPVVYRLGTIASSTSTGLLAAAMYAVSPLAVMESSDYLYPLMGLLCTVLAYLVMSARREPLTPTRFASIAVVTALVTYTHYAALFYVPMLVVWALLSPRGIRHGTALAGALLLGILPFLFWLPVFLSQSYPSRESAIAKASFFVKTLVQSMPVWPQKLAELFCAFTAGALVIVARSSQRFNTDAGAMGLVFVAALLLTSAAGQLRDRYLAPFEGLFCVFLAWVVGTWFQRTRSEHPLAWRRWGAGVTVALCAFFAIEDVTFAAHNSSIPKSGIRSFVAAQPLDPATLYVIAPDYMTATFAFYARNAHVTYTGFVQTDHPEIYRFSDTSIWNRRGIIHEAAEALRREASRYEYLDLIIDDAGRKKVRLLLSTMKAHYPLVAQTHYAARFEGITVYRFRTHRVAEVTGKPRRLGARRVPRQLRSLA
jgi:4-amino-4-deoxy-L-arabinose transferase-like glycosyltransferase